MNFVTFQSVPYIAHADTGVLCDEVRNFLLELNQIKSRALLQFKKSRYFERLTKYERFKYLLKQLDGSSLLDIVRQVVPQTRISDHERTLCVFVLVCARTCANVCMCVTPFVCMCLCVLACLCLCACVCMFACVCVRMCVCACVCLYACVYGCVCMLESVFFTFVYVCMCV